MNIIFTVQDNNDWKSKINSRFGRAEGFILLSEETKVLKFISNNENINAGHGAGIQAGQTVVNQKADVLITGGTIGPKAFNVLKTAKIKCFTQVGQISITEAYDKFTSGEFIEITNSDK